MKARYIKDLIMASLFYAFWIALFANFWYATGALVMGIFFIPCIMFIIYLAWDNYTMLYLEYKIQKKLIPKFKTVSEAIEKLRIAEDLVKNREEANDILYSVRLNRLLCEPIKKKIKILSEQEESEDTK